MGVVRIGYQGNPNIGLHGFADAKRSIFGVGIDEQSLKRISAALGVPVHPMRLCGTELVGVFCAGNKNGLLVPDIAFQSETDKLEKLGYRVTRIETELTALGNNILCNDKGCIISPDFPKKAAEMIENGLNVPVVQATIGGLSNVGALGIINGKHGVLSPEATEKEKGLIEKTLGVELDTATASLGMPYLRSAAVVNKNGMVVSPQCSGFEIAHIDSVLFSD